MAGRWWRVAFDTCDSRICREWTRDGDNSAIEEHGFRPSAGSRSALWASFPKMLYPSIWSLPSKRREVYVWTKEELDLER